MKKRSRKIYEVAFESGELYLFHRTDPGCPRQGSLYGIYDKRIDSRIFLESSSRDMRKFRIWHLLPASYRYCRLATRAELRDYMYNMGYFER